MAYGGEYRQYAWKCDDLYLGKKRPARIVPDETYAGMWRIEWCDGRRSGLLNRTRAKDAAMLAAMREVNAEALIKKLGVAKLMTSMAGGVA